MIKLVLVRHGESIWNLENKFTGWTDVDLSDKGIEEAKEAGRLLKENGFTFDIAYTSVLKRANHTLDYILEELKLDIPIYKSWRLNERHYGALQGLNKAETAKKYGEEQVKIWRRSYDVCPPALSEDDPRNPALQDAYKKIDKKLLPLTESLAITVDRVVPFFNEKIKPLLNDNKNVIIAAHGNSLRALVKYLEKISDEDIINLNIPTGVPLVYELDDYYKVVSKRYLGDEEEIKAKMNKVAKQGSIK